MTKYWDFHKRFGRLVVNLYRGSAGFIHLLGGVGIEVRHCERMANPFRGDVLQLRANDREYGREQNASVSPNKNEIPHIADWHGRLRFRLRGGKISRVAPGVHALLRWSRLLNHDNLRLRLRLLRRLLLRLIVARVIIVVGISAEQNRHERTLSAMAKVTEV